MTGAPAPAPSSARWGGVLLVLVQCATLALLGQGYLFGGMMAVAALLSLWEPLRLQHAPHWGWFALLGLLVAVKHRLAPEVLNEQITFFHTVAGYEASRFLVFVQVAQLFIQRPDGRLPFWFVGIGCLSMVLGSNVRLTPQSRPVSLACCLAFAGAVAVFAGFNRRRSARGPVSLNRFMTAGAMGLVLLAGGTTAELLRKFESDLERWLAEHGVGDRGDMVSPGFSNRGELGDIAIWKQHASQHVALRAYADSAPGYLRGMVFEEFHGVSWGDGSPARTASAVLSQRIEPLREGETLYRVCLDDAGGVRPTIDVWPDSRTGERLFLPLSAAYIATQPCQVTINRHAFAMRSGLGTPGPYTVWVDQPVPPVQMAPDVRPAYLTLDGTLRERLDPIAEEVFAGAGTPRQKIAAVEQFFHQNFEYGMQRQWTRGTHVIVHFLERRQAAHCEYFATAGALLLRTAGVPTRYVTGYVAREFNTEGGYWLARRRDAHAWIEAYDDESSSWVIVECTPPEGVPSGAAPGAWGDWWDARQLQLRRWFHRFSTAGLRGMAWSVWEMLTTAPGLAVLFLGTVAGLFWKHQRARLQGSRPVDRPLWPDLHRELRRSDRLARQLGFERASHETLTLFAARLRETGFEPNAARSALADWYDEYVRIRYGLVEAGSLTADLAARLREIKPDRVR